MYDMMNDLVNGKIGTVVERSDWDEDKECIILNGKEYDVVDEVGDIDDWLKDKDLSKLVLNRENGYRGFICYNGSIEVDGEMFSLDIVNEYVVLKLEERK